MESLCITTCQELFHQVMDTCAVVLELCLHAFAILFPQIVFILSIKSQLLLIIIMVSVYVLVSSYIYGCMATWSFYSHCFLPFIESPTPLLTRVRRQRVIVVSLCVC